METQLNHQLSKMDHLVAQYLLPFGWKVLGAFAAWFIGALVIKGIQKVIRAGLTRKHIDETLVNYAYSIIGFALRLLLLIAILGIFGIETTSFSAILAAAGVAIGMAWSGLLANFAAGVFLILFRPFRVGDSIQAAGVSGIVEEIGMFATTLHTDAQVKIFVGNNKIFSDNIFNYSAHPMRTVLFKIQIAQGVNPATAIDLFKSKLAMVPGVIKNEPISGEISELNQLGTLLTLKAVCHSKDNAAVMAAGYQVIYQTITEAKFPVPELRVTSLK